jgi:hypothetical protein
VPRFAVGAGLIQGRHVTTKLVLIAALCAGWLLGGFAPAARAQSTPQVITNRGKLPTSAVSVWSSWGLEAYGGQSGNPVLFSIDSASTRGACDLGSPSQITQSTIFEVSVTFTGLGTCVVDENQAGSSTYTPAPQVQIKFTVVT